DVLDRLHLGIARDQLVGHVVQGPDAAHFHRRTGGLRPQCDERRHAARSEVEPAREQRVVHGARSAELRPGHLDVAQPRLLGVLLDELLVLHEHEREVARAVLLRAADLVRLGENRRGSEKDQESEAVAVQHVVVPQRSSAAQTARVTSSVLAFPPRSRVRTPLAVTASTADMSRLEAAASPRWSSISAAVQKVATGFAIPFPAMSKAEPWIGSNMDGKRRSGFKLAVGAMPRLPVSAAARSERMSAWRLVATIVSSVFGLSTMRVVTASTSSRSVLTSG